jgi:TrmH family RNA methyltransferase
MADINLIPITSAQNPKVKAWASLLEKKHRDRTGTFLIEGVHLLQEALKAEGLVSIEAIAVDDERGWPEELAGARLPERTPVYALPASVMAKCTGTDTPPPVFAVVTKPRYGHDALLREGGFVVALDGVRDPGNAGTLIRAADAVGADAVVLGRGSVDPYNPKTVRSTMGSLFHLPVVEGDLAELLPEAKRRGARLVGASLDARQSCYAFDWRPACWLLLGNESNGLSPAVSALVGAHVLIPMRGQAESLNVAMAGAVLMYEAMRQRYFDPERRS